MPFRKEYISVKYLTFCLGGSALVGYSPKGNKGEINMRSKNINIFLCLMIVACVFAGTVPVNLSASPGTITVPGDYPTIQAAIDAASDGDTIIVGDGIYTGVGNKEIQWDANVKHLTIRSENGAENCIIDLEDEGRAFILQSGQDNTDIIDGFTIRNGHALSLPPNLIGGGVIHISYVSPIIQNCIITDNWVQSDGGGILCLYGATPIIRNNIIKNNIARHTGGGVHTYQAAPIIENNIISGNYAMACYGGGGIACLQATPETRIVGNLIKDNKATHHDLINDLWVPGYGGGIICMNSGVLIACNTLVNNTTSNGTDLGQGGGIRVGGRPVPMIIDCILWNNEAQEEHKELSRSSPIFELDITYSDIEGGLDGVVPGWEATNIDLDPMFVDGDSSDYRLSAGSPCIDTGGPDTSGLYLPSLDLACNPRITNTVVDMGAYEYMEEEFIEGVIDIDPNTLNLKSKGKWVTCYLEQEGYDVNDIDISTVKITDIDGVLVDISAENKPTGIGDEDEDGIPDLMIKFDRTMLMDALDPGDVEITVVWELTDMTEFQGQDTIRVI